MDKTTFSASFIRAFLFLTAAAWLTEQSCHILKSQIAKQMKKMVDSDIYTPTSLGLCRIPDDTVWLEWRDCNASILFCFYACLYVCTVHIMQAYITTKVLAL
ncbi:TPA: hypothetical protein H2W72_002207 [Salmonella enterica]|nr:hypothetical protein [Salmonella enterica]